MLHSFDIPVRNALLKQQRIQKVICMVSFCYLVIAVFNDASFVDERTNREIGNVTARWEDSDGDAFDECLGSVGCVTEGWSLMYEKR